MGTCLSTCAGWAVCASVHVQAEGPGPWWSTQLGQLENQEASASPWSGPPTLVRLEFPQQGSSTSPIEKPWIDEWDGRKREGLGWEIPLVVSWPGWEGGVVGGCSYLRPPILLQK